MRADLVRLVKRRADERCEYCQLLQEVSSIPFEIDHIIAIKHGGPTHEENLALSCFYCNSAKGPNVAGIDPETGSIVPLFHPRRERWATHFVWRGPLLIGRTASGRATIEVLAINAEAAVVLRASLIREGIYPPTAGGS